MTTKKTLFDRLEQNYEIWEARMDALKAQTKATTAEQKAAFEEQMGNLQEKAEDARKQMSRLKHASEGAWEEMKLGVEMAVDDFQQAVAKATDAFRN